MSLPTIFLSFSSKDNNLACSLRNGLEDRGIKVWKAPENIPAGGDWAASIYAALTEQEVFLLLWTDSSMASEEVTKEITLASRNQMKILPLLLTENEPGSAQSYHLSATQWLDGKGKDLNELVDLIEQRLKSIDQLPISQKSFKARNRSRKALISSIWILGIVALIFDLNPWIGLNQNLLNQRLFWQARWRQITQQHGPSTKAITLLPLGERIYQELEINPTDDSVNQAVLAKILSVLPQGKVKRVGLDFILDGEGANPDGHNQLVQVIKGQANERTIFAGLCPPNSEANKDCLKALDQRLAPKLAQAGALSVSLGLGVSTKNFPPLQLSEPVNQGSLAWSLAGMKSTRSLPSEAIIDWSINWLDPSRISLIKSKQELEKFQGDTLLIASDGYKGAKLREPADQHHAPAALKAYLGEGPDRFSTLQENKISGGVMQAVLAQSISSQHWLRPLVPFHQTLVTAFSALVSWLTAKQIQTKKRKWFLVLGAISYSLLAVQLAVSFQVIIPVVLPVAISSLFFAITRYKEVQK